MNIRNLMRTAIAVALGTALGAAHAQTYPERPIQIIVPVAVGGPTDTVARILGQALGDRLKQPVQVANITGAGGVIGTQQAVRSKPDGYTLYMGVNSMAIYPNVRPPNSPLPFSPEKDFQAIGGVATSAHVFVAHKSLGVRNLAELVALAKRRPGEITYGSAGVGGTTHLPPALWAHAVGINLVHVPFRGAAPALLETQAGRIGFSAPGYSGALDAPIKDGTLIPLAVTSAERFPFMPNVPTMIESGFQGMAFPIWYALFAPRGVPQEVVTRLSGELEKLAREPAHVKLLAQQGNVAWYVPPDRLAQILSDDTRRLGERIRASGINFVE